MSFAAPKLKQKSKTKPQLPYNEENKTTSNPPRNINPHFKQSKTHRSNTETLYEERKTNPTYLEKYSTYDSKMLKQPIINATNYQKALNSQIPNSSQDKTKLQLFQYSILKESLDQCSSFPTKSRKYIWQFLFSLPNNKSLYETYVNRGIHPFYKFINEMYPLSNEEQSKNLQHICSLLSHWSAEVGNIYFLPNIVFPFIKCFPNQNIFIFEVLIGIFTSIANYWFEYYPGAPVSHLKLCEQILKREHNELYNHLLKLHEQSNIVQMRIQELIWRLIKNLFSESLIKEHWLQLMDFLICYNHKPEMILYLAVAFIMKLSEQILNAKTPDELKSVLFEINSNMSLVKVFTNTIRLHKTYNRYQLFKYKPYIPFEYNAYPKIIGNFPKDCIRNARALEEEMIDMDREYDKKDESLNKLEKHFKELLSKENKLKRHFESEINKEREKAEIIKHELDIALYHKMKYTDELTDRKIEKLTNLNRTIKKSINAIEDLNKAQIERTHQEMLLRKDYEGHLLQQKQIYEKLHTCDKDANRCLSKLVDLRSKKQGDMEVNDYRDYLEKHRDFEDQNYYQYNTDVYNKNDKHNDIRDIRVKYEHIGNMDKEFLENEEDMDKETYHLMEKLHSGGVTGNGIKFENAILEKYMNGNNNNNINYNGYGNRSIDEDQ